MRYMNDTLRFCERIPVDIKYLSDIAWLKWGIVHTGLPKYQINARDLRYWSRMVRVRKGKKHYE